MSHTFFSNTNTLLTGAAGFIGSHLAERIMNDGGKVIGVDNFVSGQRQHVDMLREKYPDQFLFIEDDASGKPEEYLADHGQFDFILHFASPASPPGYQAHPQLTYRVNAFGTDRLLEYMKQHFPSATFLFASTSEVYGDPQVHPQSEDYWGYVNPNGIRSCYDEAKRLGETICGVYHREFGLDVRIIRIFNTYGPRMDLEDGRVIPNFMKSVLNNQPLTIYGDGTQTRSFCYVDDLVEGIVRMATSDSTKGETVNLGNPGEFTISQLAEVFEEIEGQEFKRDSRPLPGDDPTRRQPDISKAKKLLDWEPSIELREGLKKTMEYYRNQ